MHSLVYQDNLGHFSGQLNISGQFQDINEISGFSGISGHVGPLPFQKISCMIKIRYINKMHLLKRAKYKKESRGEVERVK